MSEIQVPVWAKCNFGMVRRDSLEPSHPLSVYSYIKNELGKVPEDYGYTATPPISEDDLAVLDKLSMKQIYEYLDHREQHGND